jgi:hypothetical protein
MAIRGKFSTKRPNARINAAAQNHASYDAGKKMTDTLLPLAFNELLDNIVGCPIMFRASSFCTISNRPAHTLIEA